MGKTKRQLAEDFQILYTGGEYAISSYPSAQQVESDLNDIRALALSKLFSQAEQPMLVSPLKTNDEWYQTAVFNYTAADQPTWSNLTFGYVKFSAYPVVSLNATLDGVESFESIDGTRCTKIKRMNGGFAQYRMWQEKGTLGNGDYWWWLQDGAVCTNYTTLTNGRLRAIFHNPDEVMTWNGTAYVQQNDPDTDAYPVTGDLTEIMKDLWMQREGLRMNTSYPNLNENGKPMRLQIPQTQLQKQL